MAAAIGGRRQRHRHRIGIGIATASQRHRFGIGIATASQRHQRISASAHQRIEKRYTGRQPRSPAGNGAFAGRAWLPGRRRLTLD
ncbi:hypothetical protein [Nocardia asiatica]|uniref:hypothetical protein n=1 Tax=Nocardia asiatica TaxID=209252 RepID=UPI003EE09B23